MERTKTVVLSRHGAGIISTHTFAIEQELTLVNLESNKETGIRIVGQIGSSDGSYTYGVAFLDADIDLWGVEFDDVTSAETPGSVITLQCKTCGRREIIAPDSPELDIYVIEGSVLRDCKTCRSCTLWQRNSEGTLDDPTPPVESTSSCPVPEAIGNRRKHPRVSVNFKARVRSCDFEEDIVLCENISRGGLCFKSRRRYYESAHIEIASPYSPGSPCIVVPAQIVHVVEMPKEKMFRCGIQYL